MKTLSLGSGLIDPEDDDGGESDGGHEGIHPYAEGGQHEASNGLLLRRDLHSLFDAGYVTVTPDLRFEVSRRIKEEFDDGKHY